MIKVTNHMTPPSTPSGTKATSQSGGFTNPRDNGLPGHGMDVMGRRWSLSGCVALFDSFAAALAAAAAAGLSSEILDHKVEEEDGDATRTEMK